MQKTAAEQLEAEHGADEQEEEHEKKDVSESS